MRALNLTGKRFGRLVGIQRVENLPPYGQARWLFRCDCGMEKVIFGYTAVHGLVVSCGCYSRENPSRFSHGKVGTPEYRSWCAMRQRCNTKTDGAYHLYGARGIKVCARWNKFENFYADMGKRPEGMTLDRKNNEGPYSPENCRWANQKQQVRNRRTTAFYTYKGSRLPLQEWAEIFKLTYQHVWIRYKNGWRGEKLFSPSRQTRKENVQPRVV